MTNDLNDNAALLGSRICHDLISPLGAISNGLELLAMSGAASSPELTLIEESIAAANARIRFFRVAFGAATGNQIMARADVMKLLGDCYNNTRIKIRWDMTADPTRTEAKVAMLGLLCLEASLPMGGDVTIGSDRGTWNLHAYGTKIRFDPEVWSVVQGPHQGASVRSSQVQFALLRDALNDTGKTAQVGHSDTAVSLRY
ncbi:histidine phosphotransferase family protein [Litoreibacter roseus]|uniref:Histidine phosphotransferase n=1 Tax=Litoreibacter roseus TaxID=2601869 RepID=A0A6N6JLP2_9RHOB|nr:histidine phosphotransferase family protein [Litoreibacter roseus]GFE66790.1 histidine phosphotransferase [Litoreibacter roseus]